MRSTRVSEEAVVLACVAFLGKENENYFTADDCYCTGRSDFPGTVVE